MVAEDLVEIEAVVVDLVAAVVVAEADLVVEEVVDSAVEEVVDLVVVEAVVVVLAVGSVLTGDLFRLTPELRPPFEYSDSAQVVPVPI